MLFLFPPVDLIPAVVDNLRHKLAPAILMALEWPSQQWFHATCNFASRVERLAHKLDSMLTCIHIVSAKWRFVIMDRNMPTKS